MFQYLLALLLINSYSQSLGASISRNASNGNVNLTSMFTALAEHCVENILTQQINSKIANCTGVLSKGQQLQCLMFYDINKQLCAATNTSKSTAKLDESKLNIDEVQDVKIVCDISKDWNVMDITEFPKYKSVAEKVFKNPTICAKICGVDDPTSEDANFYCKYYKWGSEILKPITTSIVTQARDTGVAPDLVVSPVDRKSNLEVPEVANNNNLVDIHNNVIEQPNEAQLETNKTSTVKVEETDKTEEVRPIISLQGTTNEQVASDDTQNAAIESQANGDVENKSKKEQPIPVPGDNVFNIDDAAKVPPVEEKPPKQDEPEKNDQLSEQKEPAIENPKLKPQIPDTDDYQAGDLESDEGKEGLQDLQGDDGDDPLLGNLDVKTDQDKDTDPVKKIEAPLFQFSGDTSQREFTNPIQEGFSEDDDHFFPFFLTAVILVVLLYVLYHNKSKVSKVFLGLIIEGRQPGRRRNSRGPAYRRLDTLEQAMSTSNTAPPSKIIY